MQPSRRFVRTRVAVLLLTALAVGAVSIQISGSADAAGPPYSGPVTADTGPAYFGPAPNPVPYCDNPTYFDPFPENVNPIGRIDVDGSPNASVTTDGITMDFELTAEGDPGGQYPGFFPELDGGGVPVEGDFTDQPKGVEMASNDAATVTLSEPLFYTQWVFTDVDRANEGFDVTPAWTDGANPGQVAVFGGDANFDFTGTTTSVAQFNDTDEVGQPSESINGRVQVDFLGAVQSLTMVRDTGSGQSGFAVGGGCSPLGVAKELTAGPTWNGTGYDVTYTIRVRNNLPSTATLTADVNGALAAALSGTSAGAIAGIDMANIQLSDLLADGEFSDISIVSLASVSGNLTTNTGYDGDADLNLLEAGSSVPPESEETLILDVVYTPDSMGALGGGCQATYQLLNSAQASGTASGVDVTDLSDDGADPDPGVDNGAGGNDDPTVVTFDCPPPADPVLEIVKTVVEGPNGMCPDFASGIPGDGDALDLTDGDTATYCISVLNSGAGAATNVTVVDPQAPAGFDGVIGDLGAGAESAALSFDLVVTTQSPEQNTASVTGDGANGAVGPVFDSALITVSVAAAANIEVSKTITDGAACSGAVEGVDELVIGEPLDAILWCFVVTNTGNTHLTNLLLDDALAGLSGVDVLATYAGGAATLAPGDSLSFELAATVPAAGAVNSVTVAGDPSDDQGDALPGAIAVSDTNTAEVASVAIDLSKGVVAGVGGDCANAMESITVGAGSTVTYCFTISNVGSTDLDVDEVVDGDLGINVAVGEIIAAGASVTVTAEAAATAMVNSASVTGVPVDAFGTPIPGAPSPTAVDTAEVQTSTGSLLIVKTVVEGPAGTCPTFDNGVVGAGSALVVEAGETVTYCISVRNPGTGDVTAVVISDSMAPGGSIDVGTVAAGTDATESYDVLVDPATPTTNVASVSGNDPGGNPLPPVVDDALIQIDVPDPDPAPAVTLTKTVVAAGGDCATAVEGVDELIQGDADTAVIWCYVVTNSGNVALSDITIDDPPVGLDDVDVLATYGGGAASLAVGGSVAFQIDGTIPANGLSSDATADGVASEADGTPIAGVDPVQDTNDAGVSPLVADVSVDKSVSDAGPVAAGTVVTYTLVVANAGPDAAADVTLTDTLPAGITIASLPDTAGWACSEDNNVISCARSSDMAAGASDTLTYTATVTAAAAASVDLVNTAVVDSSTPDPDTSNNTDTGVTERSEPDPDPTPTPTPTPSQQGDTGRPASPPPDDPGPFNNAPPTVPVPQAPLAFTGSAATILATMAAALLAAGGLLAVGSRRSRDLD